MIPIPRTDLSQRSRFQSNFDPFCIEVAQFQYNFDLLIKLDQKVLIKRSKLSIKRSKISIFEKVNII